MRKEKQLLLDEVQSLISASQAMIVTSYQKLEPNDSWVLRTLLAKSKSQFEVVKKRLFVKAVQNAGVEVDPALLKGHIGIVFVGQEDAMAPAKALIGFAKDTGDSLEVLCGQIEGKMVPGAEIIALSKLPSLEEMRSIFIGLLTSPMSQMLCVMEAMIAGPLSGAEKKSEEGE